MSKTVNNEIYFNEISYNQFINRIEEINKLIKQEQIKFKKELEEKVNNSIANIILEKHEQGEPLNNIKLNVKDIIPELMKKQAIDYIQSGYGVFKDVHVLFVKCAQLYAPHFYVMVTDLPERKCEI